MDPLLEGFQSDGGDSGGRNSNSTFHRSVSRGDFDALDRWGRLSTRTFKQDFLLQGGDEVRGEVVQRDDYPAGDQEAAVGGGDLDPEQQKHEDQRGRADHGGKGRRLLLRSVAQSAALQAPCK